MGEVMVHKIKFNNKEYYFQWGGWSVPVAKILGLVGEELIRPDGKKPRARFIQYEYIGKNQDFREVIICEYDDVEIDLRYGTYFVFKII